MTLKISILKGSQSEHGLNWFTLRNYLHILLNVCEMIWADGMLLDRTTVIDIFEQFPKYFCPSLPFFNTSLLIHSPNNPQLLENKVTGNLKQSPLRESSGLIACYSQNQYYFEMPRLVNSFCNTFSKCPREYKGTVNTSFLCTFYSLFVWNLKFLYVE